MTAPTLRDPRWSPARQCARCGTNPGPDQMVYSRHTGSWYCGDPDGCATRMRENAARIENGTATTAELEHAMHAIDDLRALIAGPACPYGEPVDCGTRACPIHGTASGDPYGPRQAERVDPEYADVDEAGQLTLGVPGDQRRLDGLAPALFAEIPH